MMVTRTILGLGCALITTACMPEFDLQGTDPIAYYKQNPVENKVETRFITRVLHLTVRNELEGDQERELKLQVDKISPYAIDDVEIHVHPSQVHNVAMHKQLTEMLVSMGIDRDHIVVVPMEEVARHDANIQVAYSAVVSPRCPDWRPSPVSSYANMVFTPNIGCAHVTNLGLMVADPHDLVEGEGDGTPDTISTSKAIQDFRSGEAESSSSSTSSITGTSTSSTGSQ